MTCRNYIPGPNGDCQRCGEMRAGHAGETDWKAEAERYREGMENWKKTAEEKDRLFAEMRSGHAGSYNQMCYSFPMRSGERTFAAQVVIPRDFTTKEAERLCAFILTLVKPE